MIKILINLLKVLYIYWVVFWGFGCILGGVMAHNATFLGMLYLFVLLCLFPLLPYFYYLIYEKTKSKNKFIAFCCYLLLFIIICCYLLLFAVICLIRENNETNFYLNCIIIHIIIFIAICIIKRKSSAKQNQQS